MFWESAMRKGWVIAAVIAGATGAVQAAEVQLFGIHTPSQGKWAVFARISDATSVDGGQVSGLSSIGIDVLNQTLPAGTATVLTSFVALPTGSTKYVDNTFTPPSIGYGFWLLRSDGETFTEGAVSGVRGISGAQHALIAPETPPATIPFANFVLQGVGLTPGVVAADPVGGDRTSSTKWTAPVQVAGGTYTPSATTGAGSQVGLKLRFYDDAPGVNLLKAFEPQNGKPWRIEGAAASSAVIDARNFTTGANLVGDSTVKAGLGDADLNGVVDFNDLVKLAQNYNSNNTNWFQGDFTYDGTTDFNDLVALAQNYNQPVPSAPIGSAAFEQDLARAFSAVPEPGAVGLVVTAMMAHGLRRRRK